MMENTDAKVLLMIQDLSTDAILQLCVENKLPIYNARNRIRIGYLNGVIAAEEIEAAWNDDTWNGKD